jgi:hypothetical protein
MRKENKGRKKMKEKKRGELGFVLERIFSIDVK